MFFDLGWVRVTFENCSKFKLLPSSGKKPKSHTVVKFLTTWLLLLCLCVVYMVISMECALLFQVADLRHCVILQNRKNDEVSYEKMLKLKKDLNKAL